MQQPRRSAWAKRCWDSIGCPAGGRGFGRAGLCVQLPTLLMGKMTSCGVFALFGVVSLLCQLRAICNWSFFFWWWVYSGSFLVSRLKHNGSDTKACFCKEQRFQKTSVCDSLPSGLGNSIFPGTAWSLPGNGEGVDALRENQSALRGKCTEGKGEK